MTTQADRVIARFGNPYRLSRALKRGGVIRNAPAIYRWTYPRERGGTGGVVPAQMIAPIITAARLDGVLLTQDDLDPRET